MSSFEERKDAFEKKFAHDEELAFKVEARCCKLFGLWAAEQLGLEGADAETYAKEVVGSNLEEPGFDDVKRKVMPDFEAKGVDISDHVVDSMLEKYMEEAKNQIMEANDA
ncbi:MAG: DUF1476 domain-containing protein [Rhodospirillales bacterium]|nr:DUF1476 domain-containing protein [Rhodospirillales bacterium]MCB9996637.1 DUF1476 domain-containing protein [Rhodospirillales bacterium]